MNREDGPYVMDKLAYRRYLQDIRIIDMSKRLGIHHSTLIGYEKGYASVPFWVVEGICKILGYRLTITDKAGKVIYEFRGKKC